MTMRLFSFIAASALAMLLSGCGLVYKMEVNQGNYVTEEEHCEGRGGDKTE